MRHAAPQLGPACSARCGCWRTRRRPRRGAPGALMQSGGRLSGSSAPLWPRRCGTAPQPGRGGPGGEQLWENQYTRVHESPCSSTQNGSREQMVYLWTFTSAYHITFEVVLLFLKDVPFAFLKGARRGPAAAAAEWRGCGGDAAAGRGRAGLAILAGVLRGTARQAAAGDARAFWRLCCSRGCAHHLHQAWC